MSTEHRDAVCLCVDARMLVPAFFVADAVRTAAPNRGASFDIIIFVSAEDVGNAHRDWAAKRGIALRHDIDTSSVRDIAILQSRLSAATLMKLLLPAHLARRYDKILYLDADLLIEEDISALFRLDMGEFSVAAVPAGRLWANAMDEKRDWWLSHFRALGMTPPYRYFNTGVLLIDLENWNREALTRRALEFIRTNASICYLPDEDALNAVLDGNLLELSPIWNARPPSLSTFAIGDMQPVIVHYAGPLKPWMRFKKGKGLFQDVEAYRLYKDFVRDTPWSNWLSQQWTSRDLARAVGQQVRVFLKRMRGKEPTLSEVESQSWRATVRRYYAETRFTDVEQGITLREGGRLRLAPAPPSASAAVATFASVRGGAGVLTTTRSLRDPARVRP